MVDRNEKIAILRFLMAYTAREPERDKIYAVLEELITQIKNEDMPPTSIYGFSLDDLAFAATLLRKEGITPRDLKRAADNFEAAVKLTKSVMQVELDKSIAAFCAEHDSYGGKQ